MPSERLGRPGTTLPSRARGANPVDEVGASLVR
jgi:hypothetical protein